MNSACEPPEFCDYYGCGAALIEVTLSAGSKFDGAAVSFCLDKYICN
jgi:hypothetical protein